MKRIKRSELIDFAGHKLWLYKVVQFLLAVKDYRKAGVRKNVAIEIANEGLAATPRLAKRIWDNRQQWLRVTA